MISRARQLIQAGHAIVSFSGAGLSAESGVPTFRDARSDALWKNFDPAKLASPEGFDRDPETVIAWYDDRRRAIAKALPNPAHYALAARTDVVHITQNVDSLLEQAGAADVVHLHGSIAEDRCHHPACAFRETIDLNHPPGLRVCPLCSSPVRPGVVWFGEMLPMDAWQRAESECSHCDLLLVIGTSAEVYPAAGLIALARDCGAGIIVINAEPGQASLMADVELIGRAGEIVPQLLQST